MATMNISSKQMESKLYAMVSCLADNYGFDTDAAFEFVRWETDVDHVGEFLNMVKTDVEKPTKMIKEDTDLNEKIDTCKKNIALWTKKMDGNFKDDDAKAKHSDKLEKEKSKLEKLEKKLPPPEPVKVTSKKAGSKKAEPVKTEAKEKRIKRFSPVMAGQLKSALESVKVEMTDKLKKEFQQYVEDLTDDDFRREGFADHMRSFAKLKAPAAEDEESSDEELISEIDKLTSVEMPSSAGPNVVDISLKDLQAINMTATIDPPGTFWDADNGRFVKGPEADDDEDFEEITFEGTEYVVGEKTGRIYEARETGDVFAGFISVGKFKKMTK
uniref:Uncharacterized protein n=1 Tax=viral metagenome TaxID=1070528 RepID=A0A6C0EP28_9ZZZZ